MNNDWAFLPMLDSSDLIADGEALRARFERDGYLYLPGLLDPDRVRRVYDDVVEILVEEGWVDRPREEKEQPQCLVAPIQEGDPSYFAVYDRVQKLESFHTLAHDRPIVSALEQVLGTEVFPHPLKIARLVFPGNFEHSTPPHQDAPNNQGDTRLTATWLPLHDLPAEFGGLAVLRGSHRFGVLDLAAHWGPGKRQAVLPSELLEVCRWVTTRFRAGDVLVFGSQTVHAALHNASEFHMRLSVDFRYQPEGAALTPVVLEPHFGRLGWDEVYADWHDTALQYEWRRHDYTVVPFEELPVAVDVVDQPLRTHVQMTRRIRARFARSTRSRT